MQAAAEVNDRLVCAVLAAQVAALRETIDTVATVDLLWRTTDVLSRLSALVRELASGNPAHGEQCAAAVAAEVEVSRALNSLAFLESQRHDTSRQMADCVVTALERLSYADVAVSARLSPHELSALYVSEDQRKVHDAVTRRFADEISEDSHQVRTERHSRQGSGQ